MSTLALLYIIVACLFGAAACWFLAGILNDRHEARLASREYRALEPRALPVDLPAYERTVPRHAAAGHPPWSKPHPVMSPPRTVRSGPRYPGQLALAVRPGDPVVTLNLPGRVPEGARGAGQPHPAGELDLPAPDALPAPRRGEHHPGYFESLRDAARRMVVMDGPPEGGCYIPLVDAGARHYADADSGLIPAVTLHITDALGVNSRTRYLDRAFDRVLLDLHAEMAILEHRYTYQGIAA